MKISGNSNEVKPADAPHGSFFLEKDTGAVFVKSLYSPQTNGWVQVSKSDAEIAAALDAAGYAKSDGTTGGTGSAGAGNQYIEIEVGGTVFKVLHDGIVI